MNIKAIQICGNNNEVIASIASIETNSYGEDRWYTASSELIEDPKEIVQLEEIASQGYWSFTIFRCKGYENVYISVVFR